MTLSASSKITIQPFSNEFGPQVVDFIVGIQNGEFGIPITAADQPDLSDIQRFYQRGRGNFWVAVSKDRVVGTISLLDIRDRMAALRKMFVAPAFRGSTTGTAMALLNTLLSWSEQKQLKTIYLGTTSRFKAAHRFYEKNGFQRMDKAGLPQSFPVMQVDTVFYRFEMF